MSDNLQHKVECATSLVQISHQVSSRFKELYLKAFEDHDPSEEDRKQVTEGLNFLWNMVMAYDIWQRFSGRGHELCLYIDQEDGTLELSKHDLESHVSLCFEIPLTGGPVSFTYQDKDTFASKEIAL